MNWIFWFVIMLICIVLLIVGYIWLDAVEKRMTSDKRCMNCRKKTYDGMMDIRCRNKRSEYYGTMVDDYACCGAWKGARE